jgi:hypothetical protein
VGMLLRYATHMDPAHVVGRSSSGEEEGEGERGRERHANALVVG